VEVSAGVKVPSQPAEPEPTIRKIATPFKDLLSSSYRKRTLTLWILWFCITFTYYGIFTWLPSALAVELSSITKGFQYVLIIALAQIPGYLSAAYLVEKVGRKPILSIYLIMSGLSAYFFGTSTTDVMLMVTGSAMSFFNLGAWGVLYTYTPEQYPTRARGTGSGAASAVGRVGGILAPLTVIALASNIYFVFVFNALLMGVAAVTMIIMGVETKGLTLEQTAREAT
jgi:putative MFS transporter